MIRTRQALLLAALAATLAAAWWVGERERAEEPAPALSAPQRPASRQAAAGASRHAGGQPAHAPRPGTQRFVAQGPDLFPAQSWQPPPPPPKPLPPPPPVAPPLPFQYAGRWVEGGSEVFFLTLGQQLYSLRKGETAAQWRLDEVAPGQLTFTYVPMDKKQIMRLTP